MNDVKVMDTKFAPAERVSLDFIQSQRDIFSEHPILFEVLQVVPNGFIILNQQRQIVYANGAFQQVAVVSESDFVVGMRPGEALNCIHASETEGGCGTTEFCAQCGAVNAILKSQKGATSIEECRITRRNLAGEEESLDLRVLATPLQFEDQEFTIFAVNDISNENRRRVLERIFFHDVLNTAGAIKGLAELAAMIDDPDDFKELDFGNLLDQASVQLVDEIEAQRQLLAAENGELTTEKKNGYTAVFLKGIVDLYKRHVVAEDRELRVDAAAKNLELTTDYPLLKRVIGNMVKNALEACKSGEAVTLGCDSYENYVRFWVHNPTYMPRDVQLQVFQRSFSTKGSGRGLGTYSMKLLSEKYLNGRVSFSSSRTDGTVFVAMYPTT